MVQHVTDDVRRKIMTILIVVQALDSPFVVVLLQMNARTVLTQSWALEDVLLPRGRVTVPEGVAHGTLMTV
jgi:hypothetical protein